MKKIFMFVNVDWFFFSHRLPIAQAAKKNNIDMTVYTEFTKFHNSKQIDGFTLLSSPLKRNSKSIFYFILEFLRLFKIIKNEKPNIIHAVSIKPILVLGSIARLTSTPFIGSISGLGPAFSSDTLFKKARLWFILRFLKFAFSGTDVRIICQNTNDRDVLLKNELSSIKNVDIISGSGVDVENFSPSKKQRIPEEYILMSSRVLLDKGIKEYCLAADIVREKFGNKVKFKLSGPIDKPSPTSISEDEIFELTNKYNVDYLGNRDDMPELLASALMFVLPSYYPEGLPKVLLEAAASGLPIITTNHPGCRDAIIDNETGFLVPPKDHIALANAITAILSDRFLMSKMSKKARSFAELSFKDTAVVTKHYSLYKELS
tara:strand:- start:7300 stop:8424 length:1125 start_codon:yes stop_codon:yes gene_type:complete